MEKERKIKKIQEFIYELKVNEGMTKDVIVVNSDMKMSNLGKILRSKRISGVPVTESDKVVGIISIGDYINWLEEGKKDCYIAEKMTGKVKTVFEYSSLAEALNKFDGFRFGSFPVLDEDLQLVGIITKNDVIKCLLKKLESEYLEEEIKTHKTRHIFKDIVADKAVLRFQYSVKGKDIKHAGECASALKNTFKRLGFFPEVIRRAAIATYEIEMNIIIYAIEGKIIAEVEQDRLKIYAHDRGPGIEDVEKAMHPGYSTAPDWVRELGFGAGMGLNNIKKCSDKMTINSTVGKGTELEIDIFLENDQE